MAFFEVGGVYEAVCPLHYYSLGSGTDIVGPITTIEKDALVLYVGIKHINGNNNHLFLYKNKILVGLNTASNYQQELFKKAI